jgi:hypothetical protein
MNLRTVYLKLPGANMASKTRGGFLIAGGLIAALGLLIPGLYGVSFDPPANSPYAKIDLSHLNGFAAAAVSSGDSAVYNGFGGPVSFAASQLAVLVMLAVGILVVWLKIDIAQAEKAVQRSGKAITFLLHKHVLFKLFTVLSAAVILGNFIWGFRFNRTPPALTQRFVADLGGGQFATTAAHYLSGSLGLGALILFFGLLIGFAGAFPRIGCSVLLLLAATFVVLFIVSN